MNFIYERSKASLYVLYGQRDNLEYPSISGSPEDIHRAHSVRVNIKLEVAPKVLQGSHRRCWVDAVSAAVQFSISLEDQKRFQ